MNDIVDNVKGSFNQAFSNVKEAFGVETDRELHNYRRLTQDDFVEIAKRFGIEDTTSYIEEMERRIVQRG